MTETIAQMTKDEFREMIEGIIEQKLAELLGDPDEGLKIRDAVRDRLLKACPGLDPGSDMTVLEFFTRPSTL